MSVNLGKSYLFLLSPSFHTPPDYFQDFLIRLSVWPITFLEISFTHYADEFFNLNHLPNLYDLRLGLNIISISGPHVDWESLIICIFFFVIIYCLIVSHLSIESNQSVNNFIKDLSNATRIIRASVCTFMDVLG